MFRTTAMESSTNNYDIKPGKCAEDVKSYCPISLLPIPSKILEILFLKRLMPIIESNQLISDYQFGFRHSHSTIEQIHKLVRKINTAFEQKQYCSAAFLDISQAFDHVWHEGLLSKIKSTFPINYYDFVRSYLSDRHFFVKQGEEITNLHKIQAGVQYDNKIQQGSVMSPILYLMYMSDLPLTEGMLIRTFADDTAALDTDKNATEASSKLQSR